MRWQGKPYICNVCNSDESIGVQISKDFADGIVHLFLLKTMSDLGSIEMTYFLNKPRKIFSFEESSCSWLSAAALVGGVERLGVPGLELGVEGAGV